VIADLPALRGIKAVVLDVVELNVVEVHDRVRHGVSNSDARFPATPL